MQTFGPVAIDYANANNLPDRSGISLWIGLNDIQTEGEFEWISGETVDYLNWYPGQPEDNFPDEDFAGMFVNSAAGGQWHDIVSDTRYRDLPFGVVEVTPDTTPVSTPEPMTTLGYLVVAGLAVAIGKKQKRHS
nr:lectin-like protein [Okeania sp. KiyG1]